MGHNLFAAPQSAQHLRNLLVIRNHTVLPASRQRRCSSRNANRSWYSLDLSIQSGWKIELPSVCWCEYLDQGYYAISEFVPRLELEPECLGFPIMSYHWATLPQIYHKPIFCINVLVKKKSGVIHRRSQDQFCLKIEIFYQQKSTLIRIDSSGIRQAIK